MKGILFKPWKIIYIAEHPDIEIQTRRVIKPQPTKPIGTAHDWEWKPGGMLCYDDYFREHAPNHARYQQGETVYIKEAWGLAINEHGHNCLCYKNTNDDDMALDNPQMMRLWDNDKKQWILEQTDSPYWYPDRWRSPMMMPEWAARHFIVIDGVGVGRVQEISIDDIKAEGIDLALPPLPYDPLDPQAMENKAILDEFIHLWDIINPDYPWESNPWVFAYTFRLKGGENA